MLSLFFSMLLSPCFNIGCSSSKQCGWHEHHASVVATTQLYDFATISTEIGEHGKEEACARSWCQGIDDTGTSKNDSSDSAAHQRRFPFHPFGTVIVETLVKRCSNSWEWKLSMWQQWWVKTIRVTMSTTTTTTTTARTAPPTAVKENELPVFRIMMWNGLMIVRPWSLDQKKTVLVKIFVGRWWQVMTGTFWARLL